MPAKRTRKPVAPRPKLQPESRPEPVLEIVQPDPEPTLLPEPPTPKAKVEVVYSSQTISRYESADGREIRKLEALEKDRDPLVILKSSTRFLDAEGNVVACSEALTTLKGTLAALKGGRW